MEEARDEQLRLAERVLVEGGPGESEVRWILGTDASISPDRQLMIGALALFRRPGLVLEDLVVVSAPVEFPYVPGFLSYREIPVLLRAAEKLAHRPDLVLVDGQGIAHPRRIGLASHLGLVTGWTTVGCAKSRLVGVCGEPGPERGDRSICRDRGERIGTVLRTRRGVKPVWVSPGHRIGHEEAVRWVMRTLGRYRLPEPIRAAHRAAGEYRKRLEVSSK